MIANRIIAFVLLVSTCVLSVVALSGSGGLEFEATDLVPQPTATATATPTPTMTPTATATPTITPTPTPVNPFAGGVFNNTILDGDNHLVLDTGQTTGDFTSAVIDAGSSVNWDSIDWLTTLPFYKEMPSNSVNETSTDYEDLSSNTLLTNQLVLWRYNTTVGPLADSSGNSRVTTSIGVPSYGVTGKFLQALTGNGLDEQESAGWTSAIDADAPRTWSFWYQATGASGYDCFGGHGTGGGNYSLLTVCMADAGSGTASFGVYTGNLVPINLGASSLYVNSAWHHVAVTYDGTDLILYFDGVQVGSASVVLSTTNTTDKFNLLAYPASGAYRLDFGKMDETAVWSKALTATEVLELYRRGANRVKFQVRSCDDALCSGESWLGPDGTNATYFTELNNNTNQDTMDGDVLATPPSMLFSNFGSLSIASNRYFQYKIFLETDNTTYTPEVTDVNVVSTP